MSSSTVVSKEFDFKLATAKDIPPAWYELVLRPELFQKHVNTLYSSTYAEPSAIALIAMFLEKAYCIPGQASVVIQPEEEKKARLIECAVFLASFLKWDIAMMERKLPLAVVHALFSSMVRKFPLQSSHLLEDVPMDTLCAHTLYNLWILHCISVSDPPTTVFKGYQWEGTCAPPDTIKDMARLELDSAIEFLSQVLKLCNDVKLPMESIELPIGWELNSRESGNSYTVEMPYKMQPLPYKEVHALIHYNLGKVYFEDDVYSKSLEHFQNCTSLLGELKPHPLIDFKKLSGYIAACKLVTKTQSESSENTLTSIESHRHENVKGAVQNLPSPSLLLPATYRAGLKKELFDWSEMVSIENSRNKRRKLSDGTIGRGLTLSMQLSIWDIIQGVLEGRGINPTSLVVLTENKDNEEFIDVLLTSIENVLKKPKLASNVMNQLKLFLNTLSSNDILIRICTIVGDHPVISKIMGIDQVQSILFKPDHISSAVPSSSFHNQCSKFIPILTSSTPSSLMNTVSTLFHRIPTSEHISIANTLQGDSREYANVGQMNTPLPCAQYNGLMRKSATLMNRKDYDCAIEFCSSALKIANTSSSPSSSRLVPILKEQNMRMKILASTLIHDDSITRLNVTFKSLQEDVQNRYGKIAKTDPFLIVLQGIYLMNIQEYTFLARYDGSSLHERICPRLASSAESVRDGTDLRRCTRELFDTISSIFSSSGNRGGISDGSNALNRKFLELIAIHLKDALCLSYLLSALVRLWNIVKKPENELSCEYTTNWPTTVSNINAIKPKEVLRVLEVVLSNAVKAHPSHQYWFIMKGDVSFVCKRYSTALYYYLEGGAIDSNFFERSVSSTVWSTHILHRMIKCCDALNLYTQAVVLCQFPPNGVDYAAVFQLIRDHSSEVLETVFDFLWDMTIIEYLIFKDTLAKHSDNAKQFSAVQAAGQPELNINNSPDILSQGVRIRKQEFLRNFYRTMVVTK